MTVNIENLNSNASTINFGNSAPSPTVITVTTGTSATISGNISLENGIHLELMPYSTLRIAANGATFSAGAETFIYTHSGSINISSRNNPLENGIQLGLMPHSILSTPVIGVQFSEDGMGRGITDSEIIISSSSRNNPRSYKNTCREENTLADYDYYNDDTDPSGVGMLVMGNSLSLVDSIEG